MTGEHKSWWAPVWRGLVVDPEGKHVKRLDGAVWLFLYFVLHARRDSGTVWAKTETVVRATGVSRRTIQRWRQTLLEHGYVMPVENKKNQFVIPKWRTLRGAPRPAPRDASHGVRQRREWREPTWRNVPIV